MFERTIIAALLAGGVAAPVAAQEAENTAFVIVDKSARASHALLKRRIAVAVEDLCRSYSTVEAYQWPEVDACRREAWASANRQVAALSGDGQIRLSSR